jgi:hypothetical protein
VAIVLSLIGIASPVLSTSRRLGHAQLTTDRPDGEGIDLGVPGDRGSAASGRVDPDVVLAAVMVLDAAVISKTSFQRFALHGDVGRREEFERRAE